MSRRKKGRSADDSSEIDLTPMLDVVFIMLIFFIVTASFVKEVGLDVNVPEKNDSPPPDDAPQNILVRISADNQIWFRDETGERRVDERQVRSNIERLRAELPKASVIIQADNKANAATYVAVQDAAQEANAPAVVLVPINN
ncbi:ExbD/TolR family protein [Cellvibrio polysaccharolyticus]|uniref:Biopolymer transporter ExbD n=1 Tax=Cellvibrio polysaccharolyticus TaxID=2082724 RepID=A0A928YVD1_9GAMM|nr:biopolymer transporter ExbD [Cellvibrio polysaccharolyticus]MBE8718425.1 biopolymer transporter ExbD [Cellvibrio polysaccharolyticus]